jgi:hypothetical protein
VIGNSAVSNDYLARLTSVNIGADASVPIYNKSAVSEIATKIRALEDVKSAAIEIAFLPRTSLGTIPIRAIEVEYWKDVAFTNELFINNSSYSLLGAEDSIVKDQWGVIQGCSALFERGAAPFFGLNEDGSGNVNIEVARHVYTLKIVGLFGRDLGQNWVPQDPTAYVPLNFVEGFKNYRWYNDVVFTPEGMTKGTASKASQTGIQRILSKTQVHIEINKTPGILNGNNLPALGIGPRRSPSQGLHQGADDFFRNRIGFISSDTSSLFDRFHQLHLKLLLSNNDYPIIVPL